MALSVHSVLAAIDTDTIGTALIVILFGVVPIVKRILEAAQKSGTGRRATLPPRSRPLARPAPSEPLRPFTWEDLMAGRVPEPGGAVVAEPEREPEEPLRGEAAMADFEELDTNPDKELAGFPEEDVLEGGMESALLSAARSSTGEQARVADLEGADANVTSFQAWEEGALARRAARSSLRPARGAWRRALVVSELIAVPATLRHEGGFPGPPLGLL